MELRNGHIIPHLSTLGSAVAMAKINQLTAHAPGLFSKVLFQTAEIRLILIAMEPEIVLTHCFVGEVSIQSLSGTIFVRAPQAKHELEAGSVLTLAPTTKLAIEAQDDVIFLVTMTSSTPRLL